MIGFENIQQEKEVWESLKKRCIPLKFGYVGMAVNTYDKLACTESYNNAIRVKNREYLEGFLKDSKSPNIIIDIGSGNGNYSSIFVNKLLQMNIKINKYFCCDYSSELSNLCINRLKNKYSHIVFNQIVWDIEKNKNDFLLNYTKNTSALFTLFGNTISNIYDTSNVLKNIYDSMNINDKFVLEASIRDDNFKLPIDIIKDYQNKTFINTNTEVLRMIGIDTKKGEYRLYYDEDKECVVGDFVFNGNVTVSYKEDIIEFSKGDVINTFISKRYKKQDLIEYINDTGWEINNIVEDRTHNTLLFFCKKI